MEDIFLVHLTENKLLRCEYIYINIYNELVELSGPFFITKSSGFDEAKVSVLDPKSKDSWFKPRQLQKSKTYELSQTDES